MTMGLETQSYDNAEPLNTPDHIAANLDAVLEDNHPALLAHALGDLARARGITQIAQDVGRSRDQLYRTLSDEANPQLDTLTDVMNSLKHCPERWLPAFGKKMMRKQEPGASSWIRYPGRCFRIAPQRASDRGGTVGLSKGATNFLTPTRSCRAASR
ncbi:addiction module antidote protein [Methylobacterium sp. AMS5]|uniref:addiction module antidote protein n=1 Tax=Methylobacterium sp. AMS5 TaxID=925818 RepID=UPI00074FA1C3|nr:addiction module antidote protein [Methylobacterium sp. AMS5]AMB46067.1 transcriptional regulator [Methylobacterium sp. AMS5]